MDVKLKKIIKKYFFDIDAFFLNLVFFLAFLSISLSLFGVHKFEGIVFKSFFILIPIWFIVTAIIKVRKVYENWSFLICFVFFSIAALLSCFNVLMSSGWQIMGFDFYRKLFITFCIFAFIILSFHTILDKNNVKIILFYGLALSILVFLSYISGVGKIFLFPVEKKGLMLTYANPNIAGLYISSISLIVLSSLFVFDNKWIKLMSIVFFSSDFYMLILTRSRNCLISFFFVLIIACLLYLLRFKKNGRALTIIAIIFFPLAVSSLYILLYGYTDLFDKLNSFIEVSGKSFNSRGITWVTAVKSTGYLGLFFGNYFHHTVVSVNLLSGHLNGYLSIICEFGIIVFTLLISILIVCIFQKIHSISFENKNMTSIFAIWCFCILSTAFEDGYFIGNGVTYVLAFGVIDLAIEPSLLLSNRINVSFNDIII